MPIVRNIAVKKLRGTILFALSLFSPAAFPLDPSLPLTWALRESWSRREGLPSNGVTALAQTPDGFLWIGTEEGLVRFDGRDFRVFDGKNTPALRTNFIQKLLAAADGSLWIGTMDGVLRLHQGRFQPVETEGNPGPQRVTDLAEAAPGRIVVATTDGLGVVENGRIKPLRTAAGERQEGGRLAVDGRGDLWLVAANGKRLEKFTPQKIEVVAPSPGFTGILEAIGKDPQGRVWLVARPGGLLRQNGERFEPVTLSGPLPPQGAQVFYAGKDGTCWIGYDDGALVRLQAGPSGNPENRLRLGNNALTAILEDREGNLWVGGQGLHRLRHTPVVTLGPGEGWPEGSITSVLADSRGRVWVGPATGGLRMLEEGFWKALPLTGSDPEPPVLSMAEDAAGSLWFSTPGNGLYRWSPGTRVRFVEGPFARDILMALAPGPRPGDMWVGASSGPYAVGAEGISEFPFRPEGEFDLPVLSLLLDHRGTLWAGTGDGGVHFLDNGRWRPAAEPNPAPPLVLDLDEDRDGAIWASTVGAGLLRFAGGRSASLDSRQGLPGDTVYSLVFDQNGDAWLSMPNGLARLRGSELRAAGLGGRVSATVFSYQDGLEAGETNGGGQTASRGPDGRLWFATPAGVAMVDPRRLKNPRVPPETIIEDVRCDGRVVEWKEKTGFQLPPGTVRCEVSFTAPAPGGAEGLKFRYRLDGLDRDWIEAGTDRLVSFTHLPPGRYRFEVAAGSADTSWHAAPAALWIEQRPALHQRAWFWGLAGLALAGAAIGAYRWRVARLVRQRRRLEEVVAERTAALATANRTLEQRVEEGIARLREAELMAAYGEMVAGVAHEVRHPVFSLRSAAYLITHKAAALKETLTAPLATLERETNRLSRLMDDLLQFARPAALQPSPADPRLLLETAVETVKAGEGWEDLDLRLEVDPAAPTIRLDRDRMLQVLVNLLENARKHATGVSRLRLWARPGEQGGLILGVENDGAGMTPETLARIFEPFFTRGAGTGLGLAIVRRIVTEHGGTIDVESSPEGGTLFRITLPASPP